MAITSILAAVSRAMGSSSSFAQHRHALHLGCRAGAAVVVEEADRR
jgi:hypothetical protein